MTTISSPWASTPITTNGNLAQAGWANAAKLALGTNGTLWVKNDADWLYLALDMTGDPGATGDKDYFWLTIDVDGNRQITPNVDLNYGEYPTADVTLGHQYYLKANSWTALSPLGAGEEYLQAVAASPTLATPHRIWEMKLALSELGVEFNSSALQTIGFGIRVASSTGATSDYPPNFSADFSNLNQIVLSTFPTAIYPAGTAGAVIAGVGFIPATLITAAGYATTPASYTFYPGIVNYAFYGSMQIKANHTTMIALSGAGATQYEVLVDGEPLLTSWNNYVWNGTTFVLETFAPNAKGQYPLYNPSGEYIIGDLLALWNSAGSPAGLHTLSVVFYKADGTTVVPSTPQTLSLMVDNNLPLAVIDRTKTVYEGQPIAPCAIETLGGVIDFFITADSDLGHLESYSLVANWDAGSTSIASDSYASHVGGGLLWSGVDDAGPIPAAGWKPTQQCAYSFTLTATMRTTTGIPGDNPYATDSRFIAFVDPDVFAVKPIAPVAIPVKP
jgi:hypothetical protein